MNHKGIRENNAQGFNETTQSSAGQENAQFYQVVC
jgi:hypothetical protein